jgi:hemolysin III
VTAQPPPTAKPRLRGVFHQYAFFVSLAAGVALALHAPDGRGRAAVVIYAIALSGLLGVSALYHRITWPPARRRWMRRLDHSMIFVLIAGTYTPFSLLALPHRLGTIVLAVVWGGAVAGVVLKLAWIDAPRWLVAVIYLALGWVAVVTAPQLLSFLGLAGGLLVLLAGVLYSAGAVIYALKRPDPAPVVFGYHEIFHVLVLAAAALHYAVIWAWVLP